MTRLHAWGAVSLAAAAALATSAAIAHPLAPALLQLDETGPQTYAVTWRTPVSRTRIADVVPQLPASCAEQGARASQVEDNEALVQRWTAICGGGLAGQLLTVSGLGSAGINVIVRIDRGGRVTTALLDAARPTLAVPERLPATGVLAQFFGLGVEHLLTGLDHVLFLLGLVLLAPRLATLVVTITAFTAGHSITLAAATLGLVRVDPALTELGIAASIVAVAWTLALQPAARPPQVGLLARRPWAMAGSFGLLHGLGFAGALTAAGLPADEVPLSLLGFNLGIEAAQLALVAAALAAAAAWPRAWPRFAWPRVASIHAMGGIAAMLCFERSFVLLG